MLDTTDFSIQACRFLYSASSRYFTLSAALAALYFLRFREWFAAWHLALCLSLLFYTMSALALTYGPFSSKVTRLYLSIGFMVGPTIFTIYVDMAAQILHVKPKWLPTLLI